MRRLLPVGRARSRRPRGCCGCAAWISLLFALTSAVGLVAMAVFAVRSDSSRWREQLDHAMDADTSWALGLLETDESGQLATDVLADTVNTGCPPLTVLLVTGDDPGGTGVA